MFNFFKIAIAVSLTNSVSSVLGLIARDMVKTDAAAIALKNTLKEIKLLGLSGMALTGLGIAGLDLAGHLIKPASEYLHQLNIMNMAGMTQAQIAEAVGDAWKNTSTVITTTATENLKMLLDLRNVIGEVTSSGVTGGSAISMDAARAQLPVLSMMQAVLASSSEAGIRKVASDNFAFSMAKALDIIGAATSPEKFETQAALMAKVVTAFQGRVTPAQFQGVFQYARQAKYGLSDEFKYEILPSLMLESSSGAGSSGGGSRGVGPQLAAFSRLALQGYINKKAIPELKALGLYTGGDVKTTTAGTTIRPLRDSVTASANPFQWVQQTLLPAIEKRFGGHATQDQIISEIQAIGRGNQLATSLMLEFAMKSNNFFRDQQIIRGADDYRTAYGKAMRDDPNFAYAALGAQWTNLKTALGISIVPSIVSALGILTRGLNDLAVFFKDHENMAGALTWSFIALSGAMAFSGTVLLMSAAFKGLYLVMSVGGLVPMLFRLGTGISSVGAASTAAAGGVAALGAALGPLALALTAIFTTYEALHIKSTVSQKDENDIIQSTPGWKDGRTIIGPGIRAPLTPGGFAPPPRFGREDVGTITVPMKADIMPGSTKAFGDEMRGALTTLEGKVSSLEQSLVSVFERVGDQIVHGVAVGAAATGAAVRGILPGPRSSVPDGPTGINTRAAPMWPAVPNP